MNGQVKITDPRYPQRLKRLKNPPEVLFFKGNWHQEIFQTCLAVVGSRRMSTYGQEMVQRLVSPLAQNGVTIVSGFMYGVDATAHQAALNVRGKTIAVMGCGIDIIRPKNQKELYNNVILLNGLILSELAGNHPAFRWTFVKRNRIVVGLSQAVLVVEAGEKSGALITAKIAQEHKTPVLAVPGQATSGVAQGTNWLIKNGAKPVTEAKEVAQTLNISLRHIYTSKVCIKKLSGMEEQIYKLLEVEPLEIDQIVRQLKLPASEVGTTLSLMVLKNILKEVKGEYYVV